MKTAVDAPQLIDNIPMTNFPDQERSFALDLIRKLCQDLAAEEINYCHWKSNNALDRSASGANDLDLLISRTDESRFTEIVSRLGFKQARASSEKMMPGVQDYFGYDENANNLVHVHAHYQLILGHDMTKNYRLPIEKQYLESSEQDGLFRVPASEFEFIVFIIRMVLKHSTWDAILGREGKLKKAELEELAYLMNRINSDRVVEILKQHLPFIDVELFDNCVKAIQPGCPLWTRIDTGQRLQTRLQAHARHPLVFDIWLKLWRRTSLFFRRRIFKYSPRYQLESGGVMIAIVGGDGSGKTTAVGGLDNWLWKNFKSSQIHMGKPTWSLTTRVIRGILKIGNLLGLYPEETSYRESLNLKSLVSPGYPWLIREVCRARDRYWTYVKASNIAAKGGIVILDRYPLPQIQIMDGPLSEKFLHQFLDKAHDSGFLSPNPKSRLTRDLIQLESSYYHKIVLPELVIVLRLEPEIAVQRKTDEDPTSVRERATAMWELNLEHTDAHIIEASKTKAEVLTEIKSLIWSEL